MLYTTLNKIREFIQCEDDLKKLLTHLNKTKADDEQLDFKTILDAMGIEDTLWLLRTQDFKDYYKFVVRVAYSVLPIFENKYHKDKRPRLAIEAVEKFMDGEISKEELEEDASAARAAAARAAAARASRAAWAAYDAAAWAAWAAYDAARAAYHAAAADASWAAYDAADDAAAWDAVDAARAAARASRAAVDAAAWAAVDAAASKRKWKEIEQIFIEECLI